MTIDAKRVPWPYSTSTTISLKEAQVLALRHDDPLKRCMAHVDLTTPQLMTLYEGKSRDYRGKGFRRVARRIRELDVERFCQGVSERRLFQIFTLSVTREQAMEILLNEPVHVDENDDVLLDEDA